MAIAAQNWFRENVAVYVRNATAVRDYRVQLRGNRSVLLWAIYLIILIAFGMLTYDAAASRETMSVVEAQASLQNFYNSIMGLLSVMVFLIAPALSATTIVTERQRRSLDLVFSAPVSPKYYLVGKLISSYRYIWMLLVLSLPVTAACVVLGGASWNEVLISYLLISIHGLIYSSIALLFSTLAQKPAGAILWSYIAIACFYMPITATAATAAMVPGAMGMRGGISGEVPFVACLSPFTVQMVAGSYTVLFGHNVPNWILALLFALLFTKLMLLGGASVLSPYGSPETKSLRIHSLIYTFLFALGGAALMSYSLPVTSMVASGPPTGVTATNYPLAYGRAFVGVITTFVFVLPFITCFGADLEKKFWPDGVFKFRRMLLGTPSGGLPFLLAMCAAVAAGIVAFSFWNPLLIGYSFWAYVFYGSALVFACWSLGRLTSAFNNGLRYARTLQFTVLLLGMWLPLPFLAIAEPYGMSGFSPGGYAPAQPAVNLWDFYILRPMFSTEDKTAMAIGFGTLLIVIGLLITLGSEKLAKAKYSRTGLSYE